ncbi:uncharacterized protein LOC131877341 isoform X1 [Tigriopus californicus]|uniref:uncharacterized protein LOC131877341 isoform X1 n=2 Tax=Tigriopus californicus TaxID=6832 RepID=UPI0027DA5A84|nr:uncharacterized protein LOC131877341 isoform X1 [Tigriopus californicus]
MLLSSLPLCPFSRTMRPLQVSLWTFTVIIATGPFNARAGLSDFGGDVSQYMNLLKGSSAFSFKPGGEPMEGDDDSESGEGGGMMGMGPDMFGGMGGDDSEDELMAGEESMDRIARALMEASEGAPKGDGAASMGGTFGGEYGDYLKLLEGDSALGFNPQADPIADNQDLQSDVFGGGMSGKFWGSYKGKASYDSFDSSDEDIIEEMGIEDARQTPEEDQPEDRYDRMDEKHTNVTVIYKPSKEKLESIYHEIQKALIDRDRSKLNQVLEALSPENILKSAASSDEAYAIKKDLRSNDMSDDPYSGETEKEDQSRTTSDARKSLETFLKHFTDNVPDPIATSKGLSASYRNLTLYGISDIRICGPIHKYFGGNKWKATLCLPRISTSVNCVAGPGVPFKGRVSAIFKLPKLEIMFKQTSSSVHVISLKSSASRSKYVPTYDSSIPLNPWSKVSMSGYMVAGVKKVLPSLVDRILLKIMHIVERLESD